jgi:putative oxidoreductase
MTQLEAPMHGRAGGAERLTRMAVGWLSAFGVFVAPPFLRVALAIPFFRSGLTKWDGFALSPSAIYLFQNEFKLHLFGATYDFPMPMVAALASAVGEIVLPVLLVLGLASRFAAAGILVMTLMIQLVVPGGWLTYHLPWAAMALALIALGGGPLSFDWLLARRRTEAS